MQRGNVWTLDESQNWNVSKYLNEKEFAISFSRQVIKGSPRPLQVFKLQGSLGKKKKKKESQANLQ